MYAYALEGVEQEARACGTSIIDARDDFHRRLMGEPDEAKAEPPSKVREQARAQRELMAAMGMARG